MSGYSARQYLYLKTSLPEMKKPPESGFFTARPDCLLLLVRASSADFFRHVGILLEVGGEQISQVIGAFNIGRLVFPGILRDQQVRVNAGHFNRYIQVQDVDVLGCNVVQLAAQNRSNDGTGGGDGETLALAVGAAGPAGVDQIHLGIEFLDALHQQLGVFVSRTREEGCAEAGGEGGFDTGVGAHFSGAHQRGVAAQEVVRSSLLAQTGNRRDNAVQIAGQEDNVLGFAGTVFDYALGNVFQRVSRAGVLGQAVVGVIGNAGFGVQDHVFQHGAETDGVPDYRLVLLAQVDTLGVAAAFDVEYAALGPAVLVVTDQVAVGVGGQGGFASAGQTEEQGHATVFAHVGGAVHRQYGFFRQQEVLHREHGFLHFTGVLHASQQYFAGGEVQDHTAFAVGAVAFLVAHERRCVQDLPGLLVLGVPLFRADEQAAGEQVVPRGLGGDFHRQVMIGVSANVQVGHEGVAVGDEIGRAHV